MVPFGMIVEWSRGAKRTFATATGKWYTHAWEYGQKLCMLLVFQPPTARTPSQLSFITLVPPRCVLVVTRRYHQRYYQ